MHGHTLPSDDVLDLFAVPGTCQPLEGGQGGSVRAGDLVLSPGRDPAEQDWLSPVLARLATDLESRPGRDPRDLRLALPVPARDGSWVAQGWAATRYEPSTRLLVDPGALLAVSAVLHAELARALPDPPPNGARHRWAAASRAAFGPARSATGMARGSCVAGLVTALLERRAEPGTEGSDLGPEQLVHGDLAGNVLLDSAGAPFVIDVAPFRRPVLWADAVCMLDSVLWWKADPSILACWTDGPSGQAMIRAALFRLLADRPQPEVAERYAEALAPLLAR